MAISTNSLPAIYRNLYEMVKIGLVRDGRDWSRRPSRPIRTLRYRVACTRIRTQGVVNLQRDQTFSYLNSMLYSNGLFDMTVAVLDIGDNTNVNERKQFVQYCPAKAKCSICLLYK